MTGLTGVSIDENLHNAMSNQDNIGFQMYTLCCKLFPICRSITGQGVRDTLKIINQVISNLKIFEIPSGTKFFDWDIPLEWNINDGYIVSPDGDKLCDFKKSNLHVLGYSIPVNKTLSLSELQKHLYSLPDQPGLIPYVTSYYKKRWGFCISHNKRHKLKEGIYRVFIDSTLSDGSLTYGEYILKGELKQEILISCYVCHPSLANNELSGPVVSTYLIKWLKKLKRRFTYRFVFIPETIGAIAYISKNLDILKKNTIAGFNITCIGDNNNYSYLASRDGNTLADRAAIHVLKHNFPDYKKYPYSEGRSDERHYCSPGVDLPVCSMMRTKYASYPEYHTSADNLDFISADGLYGGYSVMQNIIKLLENNRTYNSIFCCEPQLGKRGLYPNLSIRNSASSVRLLKNVLAYCDGENSLLDIAEILNVKFDLIVEEAKKLSDAHLIKPLN